MAAAIAAASRASTPMMICTVGKVKCADASSRDSKAYSTTAPTDKPIRNPPHRKAAN